MAEPHVMSALVEKCGGLAGEVMDLDRQRTDLRRRLRAVDVALTECGYEGDPRSIPARRKHGPKLFKNGHLRRMVYDIRRERPDLATHVDIAQEVVRRKGWDAGDEVLLAAVAGKVEAVRKAIGRR